MFRLLLVFFLVSAVSAAASPNRNARWYSRGTRTVTKVVRVRETITEATPSSCVVVQTSLPPCRHLRSVQPTPTVKIVPTAAPSHMKDNDWKPIVHPSNPSMPVGAHVSKATTPIVSSTASGWGWDFFNFGTKEVIVTKTVREIHTTKYMDPKTVVTFSVKGCRPSRLPFDLPECSAHRMVTPAPQILEILPSQIPTHLTKMPQHSPMPERGVIVMAPIQFVPTVDEVVPMVVDKKETEKNDDDLKKETVKEDNDQKGNTDVTEEVKKEKLLENGSKKL